MPNNDILSMSFQVRGQGQILVPISDCPLYLDTCMQFLTVSHERLCTDPIMLASLTTLETQQVHIFRGHTLYTVLESL